MPMHNKEIAEKFEMLADLLKIEDANPFRVRAYRNAAQTIRGYAKSMADILKQGDDLASLPGIGKDLASKIKTIVDTDEFPTLEEIKSHTPAALSDLMKIEGLGPKRIKSLYKNLNIRSLDDLKQAAEAGRIQQLEGFGKKTEQMIKERVARFAGVKPRIRLMEAEEMAAPLVAYLAKSEAVKDIVVAGSYRRRKETVGDLDILVSARKDSLIMDSLTGYDEVDEVVSKGKTRSTVHLRSGVQVDLRVVPQVSYGAALLYFTGSKAHNIAVRKLGVNKGYKINEYGVFKNDRRLAGKSEEEVYAKVDLPFIEPELREDRGEIQAAQNGQLPELVRLEDIRGDLHCHTTTTDGHHTLEKMVTAAVARGYEYISINDHSRHVTVANGLNKKRLLEQIRAIDKLNEKQSDIVVLKSIEVDILEDGSLDLPNSVLKELDFTVCSIHYKFNLPSEKQTERVLCAMDNPYFTILAHPSGRLINQWEPYEINLEKIMEAAREHGCCIEVNAQPDRLDLTDEGCKMAKDLGLKVAISTDAHSTSGLEFMRFGINQARRGWIEARDVINCQPLNDLKKLFKRN
ncbi:DNA polymerase/3'-5' exonuclease PolX [Sulfuriflexus sp.]|uniref:DNA polymerase/3'-5' exonuclease PolX n=1 Tax=Sulfuriflexus sp. TaxID=2015443 RepID=UPI0028CBF7AA|nr:DNA polymerase/3'-5' exonuclease PolX [Sulfuriflexus sp.]MDT8404720.1 DNA polymerase/3'-5' exonuclease PolX [Sulfuriflexus sp.]